MFEIKVLENNKYVFCGEFYLGIMGTYKSDMVEINFDEEDFIDQEYDFIKDQYERLHEYINLDMSEEEKAQGLTSFYLMKQKEIKNNIEEINNKFLIHIFGDIMDTEFPFWKENEGYSQFIIKDKMPQCNEDEFSNYIFTREAFDEFYSTFGHDYNEPKGDIKEFIKKYFPMIDMKKLALAMYPEYLVLQGDTITFQCSSNDCNLGIACGAYAEIKRNLTFDDWHNF